MWPSGLTLAMTLTLNFQSQIQNLLYLSQKWSDCHKTKSKHIDWTLRAQMWPSGLTLAMTLTLNFQSQIQNLLYLSQKWSDCHKTKSKHIDWTLGLKCDHWVWPWPWPNTEFAISQPKMVRMPRNEKQTYRLNSRAQMWPWGLTLAMTLTLNFQGQIQNLLYLSQKWSDCLETKSKHIDWTPGFKCDQWVWTWP